MLGAAKIARTPDGRLIGCAGVTGNCRVMMDWLMKPRRNIEIMPDLHGDDDNKYVQAIEVMFDGVVRYYEDARMMIIEDAYFAIGSGSPYAVAAMHCGKSAQESVSIAAHFDPATGGNIDCLKLLNR